MGAACRTCGGVGYTGERVGGTMVEGQLVGQQFIPTEPCPDCTKSFDAREEQTGEFGPKKLLPSKAAPAQERPQHMTKQIWLERGGKEVDRRERQETRSRRRLREDAAGGQKRGLG